METKESIDTELRDVLLEAMDSYCEGFALWVFDRFKDGILELDEYNNVRRVDGYEIPPKELVQMYRDEQANSTPIR